MEMRPFVQIALCASCEVMWPIAWGEEHPTCPSCGKAAEHVTASYVQELLGPDRSPPFPVDGTPWELPYTLYSKVGSGSTGVVFTALHNQHRYLVALKMPAGVEESIRRASHPPPDPDLIHPQAERIRRESKILAHFLHYNTRVLPLVESGTFYLHGLAIPFFTQHMGIISLQELVRKRPNLPWSIRYKLARRALEAVASVHVHGASAGGDLALGNMVLYAEARDRLFVYIIDVESAYVRGHSGSHIHSIHAAHTTYFPFRYLHDSRSIQRDVFEIGVIMVEILMGSLWIPAARRAGILPRKSSGMDMEEQRLLERFYETVAVPLLHHLAKREDIPTDQHTGIIRALKKLFDSWQSHPERAVTAALELLPPAGPLTGYAIPKAPRVVIPSPASSPRSRRLTVIFQGDLRSLSSEGTMESLLLDTYASQDTLTCALSTLLQTRRYRITLPRSLEVVKLSPRRDALWLNPEPFLRHPELLRRSPQIRIPLSLELEPL